MIQIHTHAHTPGWHMWALLLLLLLLTSASVTSHLWPHHCLFRGLFPIGCRAELWLVISGREWEEIPGAYKIRKICIYLYLYSYMNEHKRCRELEMRCLQTLLHSSWEMFRAIYGEKRCLSKQNWSLRNAFILVLLMLFILYFVKAVILIVHI